MPGPARRANVDHDRIGDLVESLRLDDRVRVLQDTLDYAGRTHAVASRRESNRHTVRNLGKATACTR